jgi:hypothetical protein
MKIDDMTIGDGKKLALMFSGSAAAMNEDFGYAIVVADRGFVYVGHATRDGDMLRLTGARNIRVWGTTAGLAEIILGGPTKTSKIDAAHDVLVPMRAVISIHPSDATLWKK